MKKFCFPLIAILPLCLSACGEKVKFPYTDDSDLIYITRNGDNFESSASEVKSLCLLNQKGDLVERIQNGESVFVYCFSYSCAGCIATEKAMSNYLKDSSALIHGVYNESSDSKVITETLDLIKSGFPELSSVIGDRYFTPSVYLIRSSTKATKVNIDDTRSDTTKLEKQFRDLMNYTNIYEFRTYSPLSAMKEKKDGLFILDKQAKTSFYHRYVYPNAIHSQSLTYRIDVGNYSKDDLRALSTYLGNGETTLIGEFKNGQVASIFNYEKEPERALDLVDSYYSVKVERPAISSEESSTSESSESSAS